MSLRFDLHVHTRRHSGCSHIDERQLIARAICAGLDGIVITEHHYQWTEAELAELSAEAGEPGFILLAGFEYTTACGDILVYGLSPEDAEGMEPYLEPEIFAAEALGRGAACIAAHPTRSGMEFDGRLGGLGLDGLEVRSVNLQPQAQRQAALLASRLGIAPVVASDAHRLEDVGAYAIEVDAAVRNMADLQAALKQGKFRI